MPLDADLTRISTFGWFDDADCEAIAVFGWAFGGDITGATEGGFIVAFAGAGYIQTNTYGAAGP